MDRLIPIKRALISVSDKTGLIELARMLCSFKTEIVSTGGTLKALKDAGLPVRSISELTGFPEILDGRVKTLHPKVHGGLLYLRGNPEHEATVKKEGIEPIDLVVVNLYPFEKVTAREGVGLEEAVENIDIGGPSMLRSAAKNHPSVVVVSDPADYGTLQAEVEKNQGAVSRDLSFRLAVKVFERTSRYDRVIAEFLARRSGAAPSGEAGGLPGEISIELEQKEPLRYGENPHQRAALYRDRTRPSCVKFEQLHGKELSYNNLLDTDAACEILEEFPEPAVCIIKHNNPCGIAQSADLVEAVERAVDSDPLSAFGGIVGINRKFGLPEAQALFNKLNFLEVVIAPDFSADALLELKKKKNLRILRLRPSGDASGLASGGLREKGFQYRFTRFGVLVQESDGVIALDAAGASRLWKVATRTALPDGIWEELLFAWKCVKVVKSNAIVLAKGLATVGIGAGQMSRVDSVRIAGEKAGERAKGCVLASDAFFPMPDSIELAARYGIRAIVQPGGSVKDDEVIQACDRHKIPMVFTLERHFKH